ncbi:MAG: DUF4270 family protein [Saprospiraceae bacterium]|nr:DUF4270 family protein [Saprospiraceae bacterium]
MLNQEKLDLDHTTNFNIKAATIPGEDVIGFSYVVSNSGGTSLVTPNTGLVGDIDDPIFGKIKSSFYGRIIYNPNQAVPSFKGMALDSAVLVLAYDTLGFYGKSGVVHDLTIQAIDEDYGDMDTIYCSKKLAVKPAPIGEKSFIPAPKDSLSIISHTDSTKLRVAPQIRIRMDQQWAFDFIINPIILEGPTSDQNEKLYEVFRGIKISSSTGSQSILGLDMSSTSRLSGGITKLFFYFTESDGDKVSYSFYLNDRKYNSFELDPTFGEVNGFLNDEVKGDSLIFLQSMTGPAFYLELPTLETLKNKIINHAVIEFTVNGDSRYLKDMYTPLTQILASKKVDGKLEVIDDVADLLAARLPLNLGFGGGLQGKISEKQSYTINITKHLKGLLEDENLDRKIYISAYQRAERASRVVLNGPKNSGSPIKLKVTFTEK